MKDKSDRWSIWSEEVWANVGIVKLIPLRLTSHLTGDTWIDIATDKSVLRCSETDLLWVLKFSVKPSHREPAIEPNYSVLSWILLLP